MFEKEERYIILASVLLFVYILSYGNINGLVIKEDPQLTHKEGKLFDVDVLIPPRYTELLAGGEIYTEITISNLERIGLVDVKIEYYIEDVNQDIVHKEIETKAIENVKTYIKKVEIPPNLNDGDYMLYVQVTYKDDVSMVRRPITIIKKPFILQGYYVMIAIIFSIFIISTLYEYLRFRKIENLIRKVNERNLRGHKLIKRGD